MSDFSLKLFELDTMRLFTDHTQQIDEHDRDFRYILESLSNLTENNDDAPVFDHVRKMENNEEFKAVESQIDVNKLNVPKHDMACNILDQAYSDCARIPDEYVPNKARTSKKCKPQETFPIKLFKILERSDIAQYSSIISWLPHGRAFMIHNEDLFKEYIMKKYFHQSKLESFKRQLYAYGFRKIGKRFADDGAYFHESFIRGRFNLCGRIRRMNGKKSRSNMYSPTPNFYNMCEIMPIDNNNHLE